MPKTNTICPFCGVGCGIILEHDSKKITSLQGNKQSKVNHGMLCIKGLSAHQFVNHKDRLKNPLIRKEGRLVKASWEEALVLISKKLTQIKEEHGPQSIGVFTSAKCTNEENFLAHRLASEVLNTNNIDQCARLCHSATAISLKGLLGNGSCTASFDDLEETEAIMLVGCNPLEQHPMIMPHITKAMSKGAKLIVIDPRKTLTAQKADLFIQLKPGRDDGFLYGVSKYILENNLYDKKFTSKRTENFNSFKQELSVLDLKGIAEYAGVSQETLKQVAELISSKKTMFLHGMGLTQSHDGVQNVNALVALSLLTGNIGKKGAGLLPLRGQNNVQGASDIGSMFFPGKIAKGLTSVEMIEAILTKEIKAMYIIGENPGLSHPNLKDTRKALKKIPFLVVQDIFPTETTKYAHVVLPGVSYAEKSGTYTNAERRVQLINKAISPVGKALPDWKIICLIAKNLGGKGFNYASPKQIFEALTKKIKGYQGITHEKLKNEGLFWPKGKRVLYEKGFDTKSGKALFPSIEVSPPMDCLSESCPLELITGRKLAHFQTGTLSKRCPTLVKALPKPFAEINPLDAEKRGIKDGDRIEVYSERGKVKLSSKITDDIPEGIVFIPFHFKEAAVNLLTPLLLDPVSKTPEYKASKVNIRKA